MGKKSKKKINLGRILSQAGYNSPGFDFEVILRAARPLYQAKMTPDEILTEIANRFGSPKAKQTLHTSGAPITYFGEVGRDFDQNVVNQIETAARLPAAVRGAVMPDCHLGYALPIGGVIALEDAVSPSFVGYDIACRMTLSVLDISPGELMGHRKQLAGDMQSVTSFGLGSGFKGAQRREHPVMDDPHWNRIPVLQRLRSLAHDQLGSSGGGNHFFDAVIGEVLAEADWMPLPVGSKFAAVMTHSGSRGVGNKLAHHYQNMAKEETRWIASGVPKGYEWLPLSSAAGQEYWEVMQLMGRYAQASHHLIHDHFLERSGLRQMARFENHHNFAFLGDGLVIHRKGATPAELGRVGIIPGSSGTASYLVEGLGNPESLNSSSHGAGRVYSRTEAKRRHNAESYRRHMRQNDILAIGVEADETFMSYKDIERVMAVQEDLLVRSVARMYPTVVIMGGRSDDGD